MSEHTELGAYGEYVVKRMLSSVEKTTFDGPADLLFAGCVPIEVKTSNLTLYDGKRVGYQFLIRKDGHADLKGAVVVLVCVDSDNDLHFFVIPADEVGERRKLAIPADLDSYGGMWKVYRDNWEVIASCV